MAPKSGKRLDLIVGQPGDYPSGRVRRGQTLRIITPKGQQVADFCSFSLANPREQYNGPYSQMFDRSHAFTTGHRMYTNRCRLMWTITDDTCGYHYSGGGFCSNAMNNAVGMNVPGVIGTPGRRGCRETVELGLAANDVSPRVLDSLSCFNFFMIIAYGRNGIYEIRRSKAKPGAYVDLRAEMDILWVCSVCQFLGSVNGDNPTELIFETYDAP